MINSDFFSGIHAVLYAMFDSDEKLDLVAMAKQVEYCIKAGCAGIVVLGLATEVGKLSLIERKKIIKQVAKVNNQRLSFAVTISGNSVSEQVELGLFAQQNGANWLVLQPPVIGNYSAEMYLSFFERVANHLELPITIQNAPQYLGRSLSVADISKLHTSCTNLVGIKSEESAISIQNLIASSNKKLHILAGRGGLEMIESLSAGCQGFVVAPDIAPAAVQIYTAWNAGKTAEAERLYAMALPAITFVMQSIEHLITYGKRIFAINAGLEVYDRMPFLRPTNFGLEMIKKWTKTS